MLYREAGQYKSTYSADMAVFPLKEDRIGIAVILAIALVAIPFLGSDFFIASVMIPFLVFSLAAIGLNILTGYTGLISLGTAAFMGVGAYSCYKLTTLFPGVNIIVLILVSGLFSAGIGVLFGLPSLRIKGFYLAVATLAAQFFLQWAFVRVPWLFNYNASRRDRGAAAHAVQHPADGRGRDAGDALFRLPRPRRGTDLVRLQYRPRQARPFLDGGARHGHRRRADGHQAAQRQARRFRRLLLFLRRCRRDDDLPLVRRRRGG